jgi:hypothetical protein
MASVEVLCLNHKHAFGITSALHNKIPTMFEICMSAGHRMFHFYGGIQDPTPFAWVQSMTDFDGIRNALRNWEDTSIGSKLNLNQFLEAWQEIVSKGFTPEWFLFHPEQFFGTDDLQVNIAPQKRKMIEIMDTLGIDDEPLHDESDDRRSKERDKARERKQAFFDMQRVDRSAEGDILIYLRKWQKSNNIEQRWLGVMSMTHYLRGGLTDFDGFYNWLCKNLADTYYLIRAETLDMLQSLVITNPAMSLNLVERLNNSKRFTLQIAAFDLTRRILSRDFYYGQRYHTQLMPHHRALSERDFPRFKHACERSSKNLFGWLDSLLKMKSFEHLHEIHEEFPLLKTELEGSSSDAFERYIDAMSRALNRYRLSVDRFETNCKSKTSHF